MQINSSSVSNAHNFVNQPTKKPDANTNLYELSQQIYSNLSQSFSRFEMPKFNLAIPNFFTEKINLAASILAPYKPSSKLPRDTAFIKKKLDNGLTYYVRNHNYPVPHKASLRLVVNVGKLNEAPIEKGIAHLIEHIAQIETQSFAKDEIFNYLNSKGVHWSRDNNAYTSAEETVYMLDVPLDDPETLEKCLMILSEVATKATLSEKVINNEREIVIDELAQGRGPWRSYDNAKRSILYEGTPYATLVDKDREIKSVKECPTEIIQAFYKRWYQPNNMAVIAVGDFDPQKTSALIEKHFGKIPASKFPPSKHSYHLKKDTGTRFLSFSHPEILYSLIEIYHLIPKIKHDNKKQLLKMTFVISMFEEILNERLTRLTEQDNSPLVETSCSHRELIQDAPCFKFQVIAKEGTIPQAFKQLLQEIKRVKEFGILPSEFERIKKIFMKDLEHSIQEKGKSSYEGFVELFHSHFNENGEIFDFTKINHIKKQLVETITLNDLNKIADYLLMDNNRFISSAMPQKNDLEPVTEAMLKEEMLNVENEEIASLTDDIVELPLIKLLPKPGRISSTKLHKRANITEYTLQNGMRVLVKPTNYKNDEVILKAYSINGIRDADATLLATAKFSNDFFDECGIGDYNSKTLDKILAGKHVSFMASVGTYITTIGSTCVPKDLETAFQLFHLMFTNPGYDPVVFKRTLEKTCELFRNQHNSPNKLFTKTIVKAVTQDHPEFKPLELEDLKDIDYETCKNFHQKKFSNPADFTVAIVGNIQPKKIKAFVERYFGSLPKIAEKRSEFNYSPTPFPEGITRKIVQAGKETNGTSVFTFPAPVKDTFKERLLSCWCSEILEMRLNKILRFETGITYYQKCLFANTTLPGLNPNNPSNAIITFTGDPVNHPRLEKLLLEQIKDLQVNGPTESEIADYKTKTFQDYSDDLQYNLTWRDDMLARNLWNREQDNFDEHEKELETLNPMMAKEHFNKIFNVENYVVVSHFRQKDEGDVA